MRARHRMSKLLLRHEVRYEDTASAWTAAHRAWLSRVDLGERRRRRRCSTTSARSTRSFSAETASKATIGELVPAHRRGRAVARLRCLRGIDTLSAVGLVRRDRRLRPLRAPREADELPRARPHENSSGQHRRQGAITKTGSRHARRLLVEAAWHYRRPPRKGTTLQRRQEDQPAAAIAISWKAQQRLHHIWQRLDSQARQAPHARRGRRRPPPRRLLLGDRQQRPDRDRNHPTTLG